MHWSVSLHEVVDDHYITFHLIAMFYLPNDLSELALSKSCAALAVSGAVDEGGDASER